MRSATYSAVAGHPGAQRLDHRVAAGDPLRAAATSRDRLRGRATGAARPAAGDAARFAADRALRCAGWLRPLGRLGRRALALELLAPLAAGADGLRPSSTGLRLAPRRSLLPAIRVSSVSGRPASSAGRAGCPRRRHRPRPARRAPGRPRPSPCGRVPRRAPRRATSTSRSTTPCRSVAAPLPAQVGDSGSRPSTSSMARTDDQAAAQRRRRRRRRRAACCPRATTPCSAASAAGTERSSSIASANSAQSILGRGRRRLAAQHLGGPAYETLDPREGGRGLLQRLPRELDDRAVVRGAPGSSAGRSAAPA